MKTRVTVLPLLVLLTFSYGVSILERADQPVTLGQVKALVKHDLSKFEPSDKLVINE